jgi:YVTN family beta-propeller protein
VELHDPGLTSIRARASFWALACAASLAACHGDGPTPPPTGILPGIERLIVVVDRGTGTLTYLDRDSPATHETAPFGVDLHEIALDPEREVAFVSQQAGGRLLVVDLERGDTTGTIAFETFRQPHALALSPDRSRLYVSFPSTDEVGVVDPETGTLVQVAPVGGKHPDNIALSRDGSLLYVANIGAPGTVSVLDARTLAVLDTAGVGASPEGLRPDPAERVLLVPNAGDATLTILSLPGLQPLALLRTGLDPRRVAFSADGARAFVTNRIDDTITVVDLASRTVRGEFRTVNAPEAILTDPQTGQLYVAGESSNDVGVHDPDGTLVRRVPVGNRPQGMAFWDR